MNYSHINEAPKSYSSGNIISRFIDGLAFRYYWATEGLREEDLLFSPSEDAMSCRQTLEHMVWLSVMIKNAIMDKKCDRAINQDFIEMTFSDLRTIFLANLELASVLARTKAESDLEELRVIIQSKDKEYFFPLWNMMNGPIADALYHTGQIVSFRRSSGNPLPKGVNHLIGKGAL